MAQCSMRLEGIEAEMAKKLVSPTGNRTPVSRVTGGDTYHYTIEDDEGRRTSPASGAAEPG